MSKKQTAADFVRNIQTLDTYYRALITALKDQLTYTEMLRDDKYPKPLLMGMKKVHNQKNAREYTAELLISCRQAIKKFESKVFSLQNKIYGTQTKPRRIAV